MIKFNDLGKQWECIRKKSLDEIDILGYNGDYIGGSRLENFEAQFANYVGCRYGVGVSNGTDALKLALQCFEPNSDDTVIIPANTFIADYLAVKHLPTNKKPKVVLIDHDEKFVINVEHLESWLKNNDSKGRIFVIAVHLYGHSCDMGKIMSLKKDYSFYLIEDCSQSHGTKYNKKMTGSFGDVSVFSLYPGKNLGAVGDAGILTTDSEDISEKLKCIRNYGSRKKYEYDLVGHNNRLDSLQCIFLSEKLKLLDSWNSKKIAIANEYISRMNVKTPIISQECDHSFHIFCLVIENRDYFINNLNSNGIPTIIHYPIPIHKTAIWDSSDVVFSDENTVYNASKIVSIPIHAFLTDDEVDLIIKTVNNSI